MTVAKAMKSPGQMLKSPKGKGPATPKLKSPKGKAPATPKGTPNVAKTPKGTPNVAKTPKGTPSVPKTLEVTPSVAKTPKGTPSVAKTPKGTPGVAKTPKGTPSVPQTLIGTPSAAKTPKRKHSVAQTLNGSPAVTQTPEATPAVAKTPKGTPAVAKTPKGTPAVAKTPKGTPAVAKTPKGTPAVAKTPKGTPAVAKTPKGTPAGVQTLNGTSAGAQILNGTPAGAKVTKGTPAGTKSAKGTPLGAKTFNGAPKTLNGSPFVAKTSVAGDKQTSNGSLKVAKKRSFPVESSDKEAVNAIFRRVRIYNIPKDSAISKIQELLKPKGEILEIRQEDRCIIVDFKTPEEARAAKKLNGVLLDGRHLSIVHVDTQKKVPIEHKVSLQDVPHDLTDEDVWCAFGSVGKLTNISLIRDIRKRDAVGCWLAFEDKASAEAAVSRGTVKIRGSQVKVVPFKPFVFFDIKRTVYIPVLPTGATEEDIIQFMSKAGPVEGVRLPKPFSLKKRCAIVCMANVADVEKALKLNNTKLKNAVVNVERHRKAASGSETEQVPAKKQKLNDGTTKTQKTKAAVEDDSEADELAAFQGQLQKLNDEMDDDDDEEEDDDDDDEEEEDDDDDDEDEDDDDKDDEEEDDDNAEEEDDDDEEDDDEDDDDEDDDDEDDDDDE